MADKLKIYIAGPWARRDEAKVAADQFRAAGFDITSRWIDFHGKDDKDPKVLEAEAINDLEDIWNANGIVILQLQKSEGKAFEQGFALGVSNMRHMANKFILVTPDGERGNVFQYLSDLYTLVPTVEAAIEECQKWPGYIRDAELVSQEVVNG